ncbi:MULTISPECIES: alpha/beta fold hydrolase [unclassified Streptomyces]|uniref:alpha/beta fold hydrolase n=1 Tax=unclassified Streptomyces TaxID=2593676 RepID=UPI002DD804C7|nr:alpha/beta hydrolase [Streptomyces sp. NBC_01445]WSE11690.1 alpha/beta hydrolase [Streptomyces sp. NBC_01445]
MTDGAIHARAAGDGAGRLRPLLDAVHDTACEVRARRPDYFEHRPLRLPAELLAHHGTTPAALAQLIGDSYELTVEPVTDPEDCTSVDRLAAARAQHAGTTPGDSGAQRAPQPGELAAVAREQSELRRAAERDAARIGAAAPLRVGVLGGVLPYTAAGVREEGEPPVVLVNALGMGTALWHPLMAALAPTRRVLTWAPRGTAAGTRPMRLRDQADDLAAVLAAEGAGDCHLVCWCSGPKTAMEFRRRRPESVRSMVFLHGSFRHTGDPAGLEPDTPYERNLEELCRAVVARPALAARLRTMFTGQPAEISGELTAHRFADEVLALPAPALGAELLRPFSDDAVLVAYARQLLDYWAYDGLAHAADVQVPVLCVSGEFDRIASPERLALAADRFPGARHERLAGATHHSMYDRPREVARLLTDFFTEAVRPRSIVSGAAR